MGDVREVKALATSAVLLWLVVAGPPAVPARECREKVEVQMDERAAESHIVASKNPELPPSHSKLLRSEKVVVLVIVDRKGTVCNARAIKGPEELRELATDAVRKHWKFRPFLVNWKPVVAQFPVTIRFVRLRGEPEVRAALQ